MQLDTHCFRWSHGPRVDSDQIVPLSGLSYVCRHFIEVQKPEITDRNQLSCARGCWCPYDGDDGDGDGDDDDDDDDDDDG